MFTAQGSAEIDLESAIGIWLFDEGTGNIAKDTSGKDNHGNLMNNPKWVQGKFIARAIARAKALEFDGNDDWVDCGNDDTLSVLTGDASVVAWIKTTQASEGQILRSSQNGPYIIFGINDSKLRAQIYDLTNNANDERSNGPIVNDGQWHHVAVVFDRDGHLTFYNDGEAKKGVEISAVKGNIEMTGPCLAIGKRPGTEEQFFDGIIDEVALFKSALTKNDIQAIMNRGIEGISVVDLSGKLATTWSSIKTR